MGIDGKYSSLYSYFQWNLNYAASDDLQKDKSSGGGTCWDKGDVMATEDASSRSDERTVVIEFWNSAKDSFFMSIQQSPWNDLGD